MRYVASKKPLSVKQGEVKVSVPSEYPQYESSEEILGLFPDPTKFVEYFNSSVAADSAIPARVFAGSTAGKLLTEDALILKCAELRKNYNPATSGRSSIVTAAEAKDIGKAIAEAFTSGNDLSADQIRALIEKARQG